MAFGASILNSFGYVQIDQDFFNFSFKSKATISGMSANTFSMTYLGVPSSANGWFFVIDYTGTNPIVAITPPVGRKLFHLHLRNETNTSSPPASGWKRLIVFLEGTSSANITYYVFDNINPTGLLNTGQGIQILNGSSQLVYHHSIPVMRAKSLVTLSGGAVGATLSMPSGRTHAYVFCNPLMGFYYPASASNRNPLTVGFELTSSTLTTIVSGAMYDGLLTQAAGSIVDLWPTQGFVVDVSFM